VRPESDSTPRPATARPRVERRAALARLARIERRLERYGCFDLVEEDVAWLIKTLREALRRRSGDT
jgi:hypothetical protein